MRDRDDDQNALTAVFRMGVAGIAYLFVWIAEMVFSMVSHGRRDEWTWPMRDLRERISTRLAVDFIIIRSKVDLWLARRIRRKE